MTLPAKASHDALLGLPVHSIRCHSYRVCQSIQRLFQSDSTFWGISAPDPTRGLMLDLVASMLRRIKGSSDLDHFSLLVDV